MMISENSFLKLKFMEKWHVLRQRPLGDKTTIFKNIFRDETFAWCLRRVFHIADFDVVLPNCHGISKWFMVGPSVRDHKPAHGAP